VLPRTPKKETPKYWTEEAEREVVKATDHFQGVEHHEVKSILLFVFKFCVTGDTKDLEGAKLHLDALIERLKGGT